MYSRSVNTLAALQKQANTILTKGQCLFLVRTKAVAAAANTIPADVKPYSEVPGPKGFFQVAANFIQVSKHVGKGHVLLENNFAKYGTIYRDNMGVISFLLLCNVADIEHLLRADNRQPLRVNVDSWVKWRENANLAQGIIIS